MRGRTGDQQDDGGCAVKAKRKGSYFTILCMLIENLIVLMREKEFVSSPVALRIPVPLVPLLPRTVYNSYMNYSVSYTFNKLLRFDPLPKNSENLCCFIL